MNRLIEFFIGLVLGIAISVSILIPMIQDRNRSIKKLANHSRWILDNCEQLKYYKKDADCCFEYDNVTNKVAIKENCFSKE